MKNIATERFFLEDIFVTGWDAFKKIFKKSIPIILIIGIPAALLANFVIAKIDFDHLVEIGKLKEMQALKIEGQITQFIDFLIGSIASIALIKCAEKAITQREITWQEALTHGLRKWGAFIGTGLLAGLIIISVFSLLLVPGFAVSMPNLPLFYDTHKNVATLLFIPGVIWAACYLVYYIFSYYVLSITSLSGKKALNYSKKLVKGLWWRSLGYFFVIGFAAMIPTVLITLVTGGIYAAIESNLALPKMLLVVIKSLLDIPAQFVAPFQLALGTAFFLNTAYLNEREEASTK